jgi:hypothetical protein
VPVVDLQCSHSSGVINGRVLIAAKPAIILRREGQEFDIDLYVVTGNLLGVSPRVNRSATNVLRKPADAITLQGSVDAGTGRREAVVPLQIPGDPLRTEVIRRSQVEDLFDELGRNLARMALGHRFFRRSPELPSAE